MSSSSSVQPLTGIRTERITYNWLIKRGDLFSNDDDTKICSPWFHSRDISEKWSLEFYPLGEHSSCWEVIDHVALYVARDTPGKSQIKAYIELQISKSNEIMVKRSNTEEYKPQDRHGYYRFLERSKLFDRDLDYDEFTISCLIDIPMDLITSSCGATIFDSRKNQFSNHFRLLFEDPILTDFTIIVEDIKFVTHKVILASRSSVFAAMFGHKDMKENCLNEVKIENIEPNVIKGMLEFIYTDEVTNITELASGLLEAADKYDLEKLRIMCEKILCGGLNTENAAEILLFADLHRADTLKECAMKYIVEHASKVIKSNDWKKMGRNPELLLELFEQSVLSPKILMKNSKFKSKNQKFDISIAISLHVIFSHCSTNIL